VIHAASYTGPIEALCKATNYIGTQNVLTAAEQCRIQYVINISTIGVYGLGPFKGVKEEDRGPRPVTALSTSKAEADYLVRSHGGITVRPGFVYGPSDRWFLPRLESILACTQTWIEDGAARLSLIDVHDLGALIAELALTCSERDQGTLFHAAHPHAQTVRDIVVNFSSGTFKSPTQSCQYSEAIARTAELGVTPREIDLVGRDHEIDSTRLWVRTGLIPGRQRLSKMRS
jgi:nucleoside-diphosphate-sugar epimerase